MPTLSGIYDSDVIQPIARTKENLSIWTVGSWSHFRIQNMEPLPISSPMVAEMVALTGNVNLAAYGTIAQSVVVILQPRELEFLQLRWYPIDDVEGVLWEQSGQGRFVTRSVHARVSRFTRDYDPNLVMTQFFILGMNRDMNLEVRNPNPNILPLARFVFFGYRYMLFEHDKATATEIEEGRKATTWIPAEGF